jgi:hypothetical protein
VLSWSFFSSPISTLMFHIGLRRVYMSNCRDIFFFKKKNRAKGGAIVKFVLCVYWSIREFVH